MGNNSTNNNKTNNHISPKESLIVRVVDIGRIVDHYCLNFLLVKCDCSFCWVNNSTNINKTNNHISPKESLNSDGQQFYQYQQNER
jgi:hypothetical protein